MSLTSLHLVLTFVLQFVPMLGTLVSTMQVSMSCFAYHSINVLDPCNTYGLECTKLTKIVLAQTGFRPPKKQVSYKAYLFKQTNNLKNSYMTGTLAQEQNYKNNLFDTSIVSKCKACLFVYGQLFE